MQGRLHFAAGLGEGLAHLQRDLAGDAIAVFLELLAEALAERHAIGDGRLCPGLVGAERARDDAFHLRGREQTALCDDLPAVRIVDPVHVHAGTGCGLRRARANPIPEKMSMLQPGVILW